VLVAIGGAIACTPLGGWLYSDPTFALSGVSTKYHGSPADTLQVILTACNLNDFNIDALKVDGRLIVDGTPVGRLTSSKGYTLKMRDSADVLASLQIPRLTGPPVHAKGDDMVTAQYELNGNIELSTPIGLRKVPLHQRGDVRFDSAGVASGWTVRNARACKPGQSVLPGQGVKPRVILDTMFRPQTPVGGSPGQRGDP
jgi:hypothetical protein